MAPKPRPVLERLWARTRSTANGCWEWTGAALGSQSPYGGIGWGGRGTNTSVHRASARLFLGLAENDERFVLHKCDNPRCWNPDHLFLGDHDINMQDMVVKKRHAHGERVRQAKLTEDLVREIRRAIDRGEGNQEIAERYGVSKHHISGIRHGRYWKHV